MGYIEKSLSSEETLVYKAHFHWFYYALAWVSLIITLGVAASVIYFSLQNDWKGRFLLGTCAVALLTLLRCMLPIWTTEIGVTNHRLVVKRGWLSRTTDELQLNAIEQVNLQQSIIGRIFDFGGVSVHGTGMDDLIVPVVAAPLDFLRAVEGATAKARQATVPQNAAQRKGSAA